MGGMYTKFTYKQLQTMKHALLAYINRQDSSTEDFQSEQALLLKINYQIELMKEKYNI